MAVDDIAAATFDQHEELMAFKYNLTIEQGATFVVEIACKDADGNLLDLSSCSAAAQIRYDYDDTSAAATFTTSIADGVVTLTLSNLQTAALNWMKDGVWDCELMWPGAVVQRLAEGSVKIRPEVTK